MSPPLGRNSMGDWNPVEFVSCRWDVVMGGEACSRVVKACLASRC